MAVHYIIGRQTCNARSHWSRIPEDLVIATISYMQMHSAESVSAFTSALMDAMDNQCTDTRDNEVAELLLVGSHSSITDCAGSNIKEDLWGYRLDCKGLRDECIRKFGEDYCRAIEPDYDEE